MKHKTFKKYITGILAASLVCTVCFPIKSFAKDTFTLSGSGTKADPYQISTSDDFVQFAQKVKEKRNISGKLLNDITVSQWSPIAPYHDSIDNAYTGVFDGNGKKVTIQTTEENNYQALFGYNAGTIQNLTVAGQVNGKEYAAGIVAINRGIIENCINEATIQSSENISFAGGITASNYGKVVNSENKGDISSTGVGAVVGGIAAAMPEGTITKVRNSGAISLTVNNTDEIEYTEGSVGGILGLNYKGKVDIAENTGNVESNDKEGYTGGISGLNNGSIKNSLNTGTISGSYYVGGISGYLYKNQQGGNAEITNSLHYGTIDTKLIPESSGAIGGKNENGTALDNYYLEGSASAGLPGSEDGAIAKNQKSFSSGEVTYLLNGKSAANPVWKQTIGSDEFPAFDAVGVVYPDFEPEEGSEHGYTNNKPEHSSEDHDFDKKGACKVCGYESIRVSGHSLTLDGSIGANFYYNIDPMYYEDSSPYTIEAEFTFNNEKRVVPFKKEFVLQTEEKGQSFGFQINIDSDQMTFGIDAVLVVKKDNKTLYRLPQETYRVYDYLLKVDEAEIVNEKLKTLTKTLATYDFYSNEHFKYHAYYEPELSLLDVSDVTKEVLQDYKWVTDAYTDEHTYRHYASTLQFKSRTTLSLMTVPRDGQKDVGNIWLGYKKAGEEEPFTYIEAKKQGNYYRANIENIPASELDETYDFYFFHKNENGEYHVLTPKKTGSPYSYMYSMLASTTNGPSMKTLVQALYKYSQASKDYFASIGKE